MSDEHDDAVYVNLRFKVSALDFERMNDASKAYTLDEWARHILVSEAFRRAHDHLIWGKDLEHKHDNT